MQETICRSYWKYGRSLWQEDIDRFLARKVDIWSLADPLPVSRAGVLWTNQGFVLEAETERDNGEDAYLVPVIAGGTVIDLCAFGIENNRVATRHGNAIALGQDAFFTNRRLEIGQSMSALPGYFRHQLVPLLPRRHPLRCPDI